MEAGLLQPSETAGQEDLVAVEGSMALDQQTVLGPAEMFPLFLRRKEMAEEMAITLEEAAPLAVGEAALELQAAALHSGWRVMAEMV